MRARIKVKGYKDPDTGKNISQGTIVDGKVARRAFNAGAAERWGPEQRRAAARAMAQPGTVIKEGLD